MKFYSEKGYTGVDIAISVIVIFIFVSLISFLIYKKIEDPGIRIGRILINRYL